MKHLLLSTIGASVLVAACGTSASDRDAALDIGAGAVFGGILGGKKGAAQGAAVGGGAGSGVVLVTKGKEVRLATGADVSTHLTAPLTILVAR